MKKRTLIIITIIPTLFIIALGIFNFIRNESFWNASFTTCISLLIAIALSFYIVQRQTDQRRQKEIFIKLLEEFKKIIDDEKSYVFDNVSDEQILMRKRDIHNKLDFISKYSEKFKIGSQTKFLNDKYEEYNSIIGNHIKDRETLNKLNDELLRPLSLMSQKIFEVMIDLYN